MFSIDGRAVALASALVFSPTNASTSSDAASDPHNLSEFSISAPQKKEAPKEEPMVLKLDPKTYSPLGEVLPPRGVLLDPRDIPDLVKPHIDICKGLSGYEASLSALLGRDIGFIVEKPKLGKPYATACNAMRDNWNESLSDLIAQIDPKMKEGMVYAAFYHDTGRRLSEDRTEVSIVNAPRIEFVQVEAGLYQELSDLEVEIGKVGPSMSKEEAKSLLDKIEKDAPEVDLLKEPWFGHAKGQLWFLALDAYNEDLVKNNPFKLTVDGFFEKCQNALKRVLIDQKIPSLIDNEKEGNLFFYEGYAVAGAVNSATLKTGWPTPSELVAYNKATHRPMLLIQVPESPKHTVGTKYKEIELSMILDGEKRVLYQGGWPLK